MDLPTRIYLDGGDPEETGEADGLLKKSGLPGVEGHTTNPSLIMKNLRRAKGDTAVTENEAVSEYRRIVREMSKITSGPISIQVTGGAQMNVDEMLLQARERVRWVRNAVIKFPCTPAGLAAVNVFCNEGAVNMTLVFSQEQAAAVYAATVNRGSTENGLPYDVFVSPFVGRLDDRGENGMDVVSLILSMYRIHGDGHVKVLTASVRTMEHLLYALYLKSDVVSLPVSVVRQWTGAGCPLPGADYAYGRTDLAAIPFRDIRLDRGFWEYDVSHPLTQAGVDAFRKDWQAGIAG